MAATASATDIKRHITSGASRPNDSVLCLADVDGISWATNRYWATRTSNLAPLLEKFNVDPAGYGIYDVNGSVHKRSDDAPAIARIVGQVGDYAAELTRLTGVGVGLACEMFAKVGNDYAALFTNPDGDVVGVRADWLTWLTDCQAPGYGKRYGTVRYAMKSGAKSGPVAIIADVETEHGGHYDDDRHYVPRTWTSDGAQVLAIVMTVRVGA